MEISYVQGSHLRVDVPSWFLCYIAKDEGQTALCTKIVQISFEPFAWKLLNLIEYMPLDIRCFLLIYKSHGQSALFRCFQLNIFWPLGLKLTRLLHYFNFERRWSLLLFKSNGQCQITYWSEVFSTQYLLVVTKLSIVVAKREWMIIKNFHVTRSIDVKVHVKFWNRQYSTNCFTLILI